MNTLPALLATSDRSKEALEMVLAVISLGAVAIHIVGLWATIAKAGGPGWASIVPVYNMVVLLNIAEMPLILVFVFLVPFLNIVLIVVVGIRVAEAFGRSLGFGLGLAFLPFIFYPVLGFGSAQYRGIAV